MTTVWADVEFTDPTLWALWDPLPGGGIFLILARWPDADARNPYVPLYVGETRDFATRLTAAHPRFDWWVREAGGIGHLYVAVHRTRGWEVREAPWRANLREHLIAHLDPLCNRA
jgi:hypothetical protein